MLVNGSVALVTGGASGIGKAICDLLLQNGAKVCFVDINAENGHGTAATLSDKYGSANVNFIQCDVSKRDELEAAFEKTKQVFGRLDIVCNNAGCQSEKSAWQRMIQVNLVGVIHGTQLAVKYMGKKTGGKGGVIINTSSITACFPFADFPIYSATKAGINMFTRGMAEQVGLSQGIRVCAMCPALVDSPLTPTTIEETCDPEAFRELLKSFTAMPPERVAEMVLQLITDDSQNGRVWLVYPDSCEEVIQPPLDLSKISSQTSGQ